VSYSSLLAHAVIGCMLCVSLGCYQTKDSESPSWLSVDSSEQIKDLTHEEARQYCFDMQDWRTDFFNDPANKSTMCVRLAVAVKLSSIPEDCEQTYDSCMQEQILVNAVDCDSIEEPPQECEATVSEAVWCTEADVKKMIREARDLTCASTKLPKSSEPSDSCKVIYDKCTLNRFTRE